MNVAIIDEGIILAISEHWESYRTAENSRINRDLRSGLDAVDILAPLKATLRGIPDELTIYQQGTTPAVAVESIDFSQPLETSRETFFFFVETLIHVALVDNAQIEISADGETVKLSPQQSLKIALDGYTSMLVRMFFTEKIEGIAAQRLVSRTLSPTFSEDRGEKRERIAQLQYRLQVEIGS